MLTILHYVHKMLIDIWPNYNTHNYEVLTIKLVYLKKKKNDRLQIKFYN